jgi:uncharacterized protein YutE (UPF0331/DUF86 family)
MTDLDRALIRRKLATMVRNLDDLAEIEGLTVEEFTTDRFRQKGTERLLQEVVECAVDINVHLLRARGRDAPPDYFRSFIRLGEAGDIPPELAAALAPSAGLRNRLVHEYDAIDDEIVLEAVREARAQYGRYVEAIERVLTEPRA